MSAKNLQEIGGSTPTSITEKKKRDNSHSAAYLKYGSGEIS